jgi:hypothetical protein
MASDHEDIHSRKQNYEAFKHGKGKFPRREDVWGSRGIAPAFNFGTRWRCVFGRFTPGEIAPDTYWIVPIAGVDVAEKRIISCPFREPKPDRPERSLSLYRLSCLRKCMNFL